MELSGLTTAARSALKPLQSPPIDGAMIALGFVKSEFYSPSGIHLTKIAEISITLSYCRLLRMDCGFRIVYGEYALGGITQQFFAILPIQHPWSFHSFRERRTSDNLAHYGVICDITGRYLDLAFP